MEAAAVPSHPVPAPGAAPAQPSTTWAAAAQFSEAQQRIDAAPEPVLAPVGEAGAPAPAAKLTPARLAEVLKGFDKPVTLDAIVQELKHGRAEGESYIPSGVVQTVADAMIATGGVVKTSVGTPPIDHYALAPVVTEPVAITLAPPVAITARTVIVTARAAVVAALALDLIYPVGGPLAGPPERAPGGCFDIFQIAYVVHVAAEEEKPAIAIGKPFVEALTAGIDRNDIDGLGTRITEHLVALQAAGYITTTMLPPKVRAPGGAETDSAETMTLYALSGEALALFQARGAFGVADSTLPPEPTGPSVEEQIAAAVAPVKKELVLTIEQRSAAIVERDTHWFALRKSQDLADEYRKWFVRHGIQHPDLAAGARASGAERKVLKEYPFDVIITEEQHWRIIEERASAKHRLTELEGAAAVSKDTWKSRVAEAQALVDRLEQLSEYKPGTRHIFTKSVYKEVENGEIVIYSADEHDYGVVIDREPIPAGTQRVIAGTSIAEVPPAPKERKVVPLETIERGTLGDKIVAAIGGTHEIVNGELVVTLHKGDLPAVTAPPAPDSDAGRVLTILRTKGAMDEKKLAKKAKLELPQLIAALAALGNLVAKDGSNWKATVPQPAAAVAEAKPSAGGSQDLTLPAIRVGLQKLFTTEPVKSTGLVYHAVVATYLHLLGIAAAAATEKIVTIALDAMLRDAVLSEGEGGADRLIWGATEVDPRVTSADRKARVTQPEPLLKPTKATGEGEPEGDEGEEAEPPAASPKAKTAKKTAAKKAKGRQGKAKA